MANIVKLTVGQDSLAQIVIDTPDSKLNVLSKEFFAEFIAALDELAGRKDVRGLVISSGKEDNFFAGADVKEIRVLQAQPSKAIYDATMNGRAVFNRVASLPFPTVAAINGICLGGGLELALACKFRLASTSKKTQLGVPEVMLGFIPGWGGSIRLPRLIGLQEGFTLISTGNKVDVGKAWRLGLVDETVAPELLVKRAGEIALGAKPKRYSRPLKKSLIAGFLHTKLGRLVFNNMAGKMVMATTKGKYPAPMEALKLILKTWEMPEANAFELESQTFAKLATGAVSRSLVGVFFADTESKKMPEGVKPAIKVQTVGVLGAGVMGAGIAQAAAYAGYNVVLKDINEEALKKGMDTIKGLFDGLVKKRKLTAEEAAAMLARVRPTVNYSDMADCDLVIEAVVEKMVVKKAVRTELEKVIVGKPFVFASNTSSLSLNEMAEGAQNPANVVGLHFFNPVHKMKLIEVVAANTTSPETIALAKAFGMKLGKTTVSTNDGPGFVVNRILSPYMKEAIELLLAGVPGEEIDKAATRFGMPMGPIALMDEVGLDIVTHVIKVMHAALGDRLTPPSIIETFEQHKLLGKKGGKGLYLYDEKTGRRAGINPEITATIKAPAVSMSPATIQDRLFLPMVNEAALCLQENIISDPGQLDLAMIYGTGFAPFLGGVLGYADSVGIKTVAQKLEMYAQVAGANYTPAQLILDMASRGESFYKDK